MANNKDESEGKNEGRDEVEAKYHATPKIVQHYAACVGVAITSVY